MHNWIKWWPRMQLNNLREPEWVAHHEGPERPQGVERGAMTAVIREPVCRQPCFVRLRRLLRRVELLFPVWHGLAVGRQAFDVTAMTITHQPSVWGNLLLTLTWLFQCLPAGFCDAIWIKIKKISSQTLLITLSLLQISPGVQTNCYEYMREQ